MAEWWRNNFNSWFGSNITYVTNGYVKADYVWLLFHNTRFSFNGVSLSGSAKNFDVKFSGGIEKEKVTEKVRIPFRDFHKKQRNTSSEYITILAKDRDGNDVTICENYEIGANRSFIITQNAGIKPQRYGDSNLWRDEFGYDHKP